MKPIRSSSFYLVLAIFLSFIPFFVSPILNFTFESLQENLKLASQWEYRLTRNMVEDRQEWKSISLPYEFTNQEERIYLWNKIKLESSSCKKNCTLYFEHIDQYFEMYLDEVKFFSNIDFSKNQFPRIHPVNQSILVNLPDDFLGKTFSIKIASNWGRIGIIGTPILGRRDDIEKHLFRSSIGYLLITAIYIAMAAFLLFIYKWTHQFVLVRDLGWMSLLSAILTFYHFPAKQYLTDSYAVFVLSGLGSLAFYPVLIYRLYNLVLFDGINPVFKKIAWLYFFVGFLICISFFAFENQFLFFVYGAWPFYAMRAFDIFFLTFTLFNQLNKNKFAKILLLGISFLSICIIPNLLFQLGVMKNYNYFSHLGFFTILITFLTVAGLKLNSDLYEKEKAQLELLRQAIHPHFLTNSLSALIQWTEEDPKKAGKLLFSLARLLRSMLDIGHERLIPINREIELCEDHIAIMQSRFEKKYEFIKEGISGEEWIPPFAFHTLVENAFKHTNGNGDMRFTLNKSTENKRDIYCFTTDGIVSREQGGAKKEGTGFQYVRVRLREAYGANFFMRYGITEEGTFEVKISVPSG